MPNPYEEIFEDDKEHKKETSFEPPKLPPLDMEEEDRFILDGKEPLDEILENTKLFQQEAESFSQLLSRTRAIDHKVPKRIVRLFVVDKDPPIVRNLKEERQYQLVLQEKFKRIIVPMRKLAEIHLATVRQFNRDIDKNYYSIEKIDREVRSDKLLAIEGLNMQRKILADAASDLIILKNALIDSERRMKTFIKVGGTHNISNAEYSIIAQKRTTLTSGRTHQFDYSFFGINILDKTVISLGIYMKETTSQYLGKLIKIFE